MAYDKSMHEDATYSKEILFSQGFWHKLTGLFFFRERSWSSESNYLYLSLSLHKK